jgi:F0F1-type ATP synthase membrane subunit b/b'
MTAVGPPMENIGVDVAVAFLKTIRDAEERVRIEIENARKEAEETLDKTRADITNEIANARIKADRDVRNSVASALRTSETEILVLDAAAEQEKTRIRRLVGERRGKSVSWILARMLE